jgi:hypothetical protein
MKVQAKAGATWARLDDSDAGEGLSIFFSQKSTDEVRWRLDVYAKLDTGAELLVGWFYVSPPSATDPIGPVTRQVGAAVCPGAKTWSVCASPALGSQVVVNETADISLNSSKCCTAPVGVTRVGERYGYLADSAAGITQFANSLFPGRTITSIAAVGLVGGGSVQINSGPVITVPAGVGFNLEPGALIQKVDASTGSSPVITMTNVVWVIEFLESA